MDENVYEELDLCPKRFPQYCSQTQVMTEIVDEGMPRLRVNIVLALNHAQMCMNTKHLHLDDKRCI